MRSAKEQKNMGRPKAREPRTRQLNISFTVSEIESIRTRASVLGMRPSFFGRAMLLDAKAHPGAAPEEDRRHRLLRQQLIRLGNNLNQMVRHLHQTGDPRPADLEPLLKDIREIIARFAP